jgi:hypothetical protein
MKNSEIKKELKFLRRVLVKLTSAVYTHTRTDMAPDSALPKMKKLKKLARRGP